MANAGIVHSDRIDVAALQVANIEVIDFSTVGLPRRLPDEFRLITGPAEPPTGYVLGVKLVSTANVIAKIGGGDVPAVTLRQFFQPGESQLISATHVVLADCTPNTVWDVIYYNLPERVG